MMAENYLYRKENVLVTELVRRGLFGQVYYAEGAYLHELKQLNEDTPWRRTWQTGIAGVTYGTHSLGPILQWMPGDRVAEVCCADTEVRLRDPRGDQYAQMTPVIAVQDRAQGADQDPRRHALRPPARHDRVPRPGHRWLLRVGPHP